MKYALVTKAMKENVTDIKHWIYMSNPNCPKNEFRENTTRKHRDTIDISWSDEYVGSGLLLAGVVMIWPGPHDDN